MKILVLRTDIKTRKMVKKIKPTFNSHPLVIDWSVDVGDIDNVLRIEANDGLEENNVINLVKASGFHCEALAD